jgi:hypothetical protein
MRDIVGDGEIKSGSICTGLAAGDDLLDHLKPQFAFHFSL